MPQKQLYKVMEEQMGVEWESNFGSFDTIPFAAASIGQVHKATLSKDLAEKYGFSDVAVKVQYPGVSKSIDSDLSNLQSLLHLSKLLPKGMYLENSIRVARKELAWECDYLREAECNRKFVDIFTGSTVFKIPRVVNELSNSMVITTEFVNGDPISAVVNYDQETRDWVGTMIMELCLQELFVHKFMQTDPNWTNFLYDHSSRKIGLLDFGASRGYDVDFLDPYMQVLRASASSDRKSIAKWSEVLGFLTGYESQAMLDAHTDSVLELGKPFRDHGLFDFGRQQVTSNVKSNIPTMLNERLTPPPDETYSLHRKLSGAYLLCARIKARVPCRDLFFKYSDAYTVSQKYAA
ncbi:AarF domain-containing protein kinase 4 [Zancudomyces culisetae]|uniref:AarF domain-containing protein kinase 4 n=1 Tax=Zancudomyces culisetae TaxID=1213189 RepID=A0A1R1PMY2_ZANCU|nr:AarF domain-containing protein kinase 4 [Zancudomyces culisetae]|eukprot:OMH82262.1 AarF domain-containing protein kinase 4 [Zancudomyces culisetae]